MFDKGCNTLGKNKDQRKLREGKKCAALDLRLTFQRWMQNNYGQRQKEPEYKARQAGERLESRGGMSEHVVKTEQKEKKNTSKVGTHRKKTPTFEPRNIVHPVTAKGR